MANHNLTRAVRLALLAAGATSAGAYVSGAAAQDAALEQVVVTGSRIAPRIGVTSVTSCAAAGPVFPRAAVLYP